MTVLKRPMIVEPWHPDLLSRKFIEELFSGLTTNESRRFIEVNPSDIRGNPPLIKVGEIVKSKSPQNGVVLETYLVERWLNRKGGTWSADQIIAARPNSYEQHCLVKWLPKKRLKDTFSEALIVPASSLQSISKEVDALRAKTEASLKKLKALEEGSDILASYYKEFVNTPKSEIPVTSWPSDWQSFFDSAGKVSNS